MIALVLKLTGALPFWFGAFCFVFVGFWFVFVVVVLFVCFPKISIEIKKNQPEQIVQGDSNELC